MPSTKGINLADAVAEADLTDDLAEVVDEVVDGKDETEG